MAKIDRDGCGKFSEAELVVNHHTPSNELKHNLHIQSAHISE